MKVGELRKQGFKAIAGDTLTNGLSDSIKLSIGGAVAVNDGYHDDLEVVDLLWRTEPCDGFIGIVDFEDNCWRPYIDKSADADKPAVAIDEKPAFTQAMADAGELPPVGSNFRTDGDEDCDDGYCYLRCVANHIDGGVIGQDDSARMFWVMAGAMALDNRTPKQKAVDAAVYAVEKKGFIANDLLAATEAFGIAFDAGLLHLKSNEQ